MRAKQTGDGEIPPAHGGCVARRALAASGCVALRRSIAIARCGRWRGWQVAERLRCEGALAPLDSRRVSMETLA